MSMPDMTREGKRKRQRAWQMGQEIAQTLEREVESAEWSGFSREERVEFLRGVGQYFNNVAHDLATEEALAFFASLPPRGDV